MAAALWAACAPRAVSDAAARRDLRRGARVAGADGPGRIARRAAWGGDAGAWTGFLANGRGDGAGAWCSSARTALFSHPRRLLEGHSTSITRSGWPLLHWRASSIRRCPGWSRYRIAVSRSRGCPLHAALSGQKHGLPRQPDARGPDRMPSDQRVVSEAQPPHLAVGSRLGGIYRARHVMAADGATPTRCAVRD